MAEQKIDSIFDLGKIEAEITKIAAKMSEQFGKATNINSLSKGVKGSKGVNGLDEGYAQALKELDSATRQLAAAQEQLAVSNAKLKVSNSALRAEQKLTATVASEHTTALQKMYAQMKLLEIEMQSKFNPALKEQSKEFQNLNAQHSKLQSEYQRTARATGVMGRSINSTYGSTFQLTQVMRELPNFAIDARIGFMALSNNLPMLADSFKQLKQQIIDTEGAAGASRKTWAAFGKSLLSLNTIMIVASTLFVLFGDDIVTFATKLFKGSSAMDGFSESMRAMLKVSTDMSGQALTSIERIEKLGAQIRTYNSDVDDSKTIIDEFNSVFGTHLTTINQVKIAYDELSKAAIDNAIKMQASMDLIAKASKQLLRQQGAQNILSNFSPQQVSETENRLDNYFNNLRDRMRKAGADEQEIIKGVNAEAERLKKGDFGAAGTGNVILDAILGNAKEDEISKYLGKMGKNGKMIIKAILDERAASVAIKGLRKSIDEIMPDTIGKAEDAKGKAPISLIRDNLGPLKGLDPMSFTKDTGNVSPTGLNLDINNSDAINQMMAVNNDAYKQGLIKYQDYFKKRQEIYKLATATETTIHEETVMDSAKADADHMQRLFDIYSQGLDIIAEAVQGFYDRYFEMLENEKKKQEIFETEKISDVEDRERAGVLSKEDAEKEKSRIAAYYQSVDEEIERKKLEKEKEAFIIDQAFKLGQVWINFAAASASLENMLALGLLTPLYLTQALTSTALIAAQTIPAFAEGGDMLQSGKAWLGDGGKNELAISPSGKMFISGNTPQLYELEKGTHIFPDVNKVDLNSILAMKQVMPNIGAKGDDRLMKELISTVRGQKQGNFYGMPLIRQMNMSDRYSSRKRGLMN